MISMKQLETDLTEIVTDVLEKSGIQSGEIFVLGCSSSEVAGGTIGQNSSKEIGETIIRVLKHILDEKGIHLAVQGCEHINRALTIEKQVAVTHHFEQVNVVPALHAGGSCAVAAYEQMTDPIEIEHITAKAGIDIGDTSIGMHIKHVQVPIRPVLKELGGAHVTALTSRPKLIGGERAVYK
ncbi:TIGR01440 family protein [Vagococcus humatus]|uniref:UPF0340 protein C7P63_08455 n=1 Tax=Vagococcus humatus TaxID=1889241 RepID=A0A3S0ACW9_9ENTE|nr:TIGR01440 family protein [Vagococcus humatus]RST88842.1 TIGR01440 family protein [Vagococcus humatus]